MAEQQKETGCVLELDQILCPDGKVRRIKSVEFGPEASLGPAAGCFLTFEYDPQTNQLKPKCVGQCPQANYECTVVTLPTGGITCQCKLVI